MVIRLGYGWLPRTPVCRYCLCRYRTRYHTRGSCRLVQFLPVTCGSPVCSSAGSCHPVCYLPAGFWVTALLRLPYCLYVRSSPPHIPGYSSAVLGCHTCGCITAVLPYAVTHLRFGSRYLWLHTTRFTYWFIRLRFTFTFGYLWFAHAHAVRCPATFLRLFYGYVGLLPFTALPRLVLVGSPPRLRTHPHLPVHVLPGYTVGCRLVTVTFTTLVPTGCYTLRTLHHTFYRLHSLPLQFLPLTHTRTFYRLHVRVTGSFVTRVTHCGCRYGYTHMVLRLRLCRSRFGLQFYTRLRCAYYGWFYTFGCLVGSHTRYGLLHHAHSATFWFWFSYATYTAFATFWLHIWFHHTVYVLPLRLYVPVYCGCCTAYTARLPLHVTPRRVLPVYARSRSAGYLPVLPLPYVCARVHGSAIYGSRFRLDCRVPPHHVAAQFYGCGSLLRFTALPTTTVWFTVCVLLPAVAVTARCTRLHAPRLPRLVLLRCRGYLPVTAVGFAAATHTLRCGLPFYLLPGLVTGSYGSPANTRIRLDSTPPLLRSPPRCLAAFTVGLPAAHIFYGSCVHVLVLRWLLPAYGLRFTTHTHTHARYYVAALHVLRYLGYLAV